MKGMVCVMFLFSILPIQAQDIAYNDFFTGDTMRIDYFHIGDAKAEVVTLDRVYRQKAWAGPHKNLLDPFNRGRYRVKILDKASEVLLYSRGFGSLFGEYRTTTPALNGIQRTFHETALIPYPKQAVRFLLESRDRQNVWTPLFETEIDPSDMYIAPRAAPANVKVFPLHRAGEPSRCLDLSVLAEGYRADEEAKVKADFTRYCSILLGAEPYRSLKDKINVNGVFAPSPESGCLEPSHGSYPRTAIGASFDSFGSERYVLAENNRDIQDIASAAPADAIVILINSDRYGGGGIYNLYATFTADNVWHEYLMLHEFGHSFTGLADEYYTSSVAYNEFYPAGVEPVEPNITALLPGQELKWKALADPKLPVPTPWNKELYDSMDAEYQKVRAGINARIAAMKREGKPREEIEALQEESDKLSQENARKMDQILRKNRNFGKAGAFEGAGYAAKGLYRPELDCLMFSKGNKPLCRVCREAVTRVILHYCD